MADPAAIIKTLAYFDLFEYPLTTFEVWQWLWSENGQSTTMREVSDALSELAAAQRIEAKQGFWFLPGREEIVETRQARHRASISKLARAERLTKLFSWLPWIEGVAVCNSLGYHNATTKSDIDLFVITAPNAIWRTRLFAAGFMALLGERPTHEHAADTICLSFFVSRDAMNLAALQKANGDPYFIFWTTQLLPIFGRGNVWEDFWQANAWVKQTLPNALGYQTKSPNFFRVAKKRLSGSASAFERMAKKIQLRRLPENLRTRAATNNDVVISDLVLKFHANDRREEYRERWRATLASLHS